MRIRLRKMRPVDIAARFGENLRRCRGRANISQEELGIRASLHRTQIGMLESGTRLARIDTLVKLAGALSVPPADLLEGIRWSPAEPQRGRFKVEDDEAGAAQAGPSVAPTRSS